MTRKLAQYPFPYIGRIQPKRDETGTIKEFAPHSGYRNVRRLLLHKYGAGPFCRFRIPRHFPFEGVYALLVNGSVAYVGECMNLSSRFNTGYGQISPRNRYQGGQSTNCKINHRVLEAAKRGNPIEIWFLQTAYRKEVESELTGGLKPPWNDQGTS